MARETAGGIITRAQRVLGEVGAGERWTRPELLQTVNAGRREVVAKQPGAGLVTAVLALAAGVVQTAPEGMDRVDAVTCNTTLDGGGGRVIGATDRDGLARLSPAWMLKTSDGPVLLWAPVPGKPRNFYVYPGRSAEAPGYVEVCGLFSPADIGEKDLLAVGVGDEFAETLLHYVLGWAFAKSGEDTELAALAEKHQLAFYQMLGATGTVAEGKRGGG